ncbi:MAG: GntR family transcriptional regulator [Ancrocorticia sp.]|uniref:GntR family transcriptional regulator n=1 Tax=Ancrocorticia sp. TaxID=2593684 RepID=UPI003F9088E0
MDFSDDRPIYLQIADSIRSQILTESLKPGDQLMSTTQYANTFRINPATANKAFGLLVDDGTVAKRRGVGMFVTDEAPEILREEGKKSYVPNHLEPALSEGLELGLTPEEILGLARNFFTVKEQS